MQFIRFPLFNEQREFIISRTEVEREDNLLIGISGVTGEEGDYI